MKLYVNVNAAFDGIGTQDRPFRSINEAAKIAKPGDEVLVAPGVYREYVNPVNAGEEDARITYRSVEPLGAVITGAEQIKDWTLYEGNVWVCRVKNSIFGGYNPYTTFVYGDWYFATADKHTGCVYLNDKAMVLFEIGHDQGKDVSELLKRAGFTNVWVKKDLAGLDRVVIAMYNINNCEHK